MSIRKKLAAVAAAGATATVGFGMLAGSAFASTTVSVTPNPIPYVDTSNAGGGANTSGGEIINISVPANSTLLPNSQATIMECSTAVLTANGDNVTSCDPVTAAYIDANNNVMTTGADGSLNVQFPVNVLPNSFFDPNSTILVDSNDPLVLWIGSDFNASFASHSLLSAAIPLTTATTGGPGSGVPEAPMAILLPLGAVGVIGGGVVLSRRRRRAGAAA